jgi:hypothetical protein
MGAAMLPERDRSQENSRPPAEVTVTPAVTPAMAWRRLVARPLTRSASSVGRMCQRPNTVAVAATAARSGRTRRRAAWSTPRNAVSSHSTVPSGMRIAAW